MLQAQQAANVNKSVLGVLVRCRSSPCTEDASVRVCTFE